MIPPLPLVMKGRVAITAQIMSLAKLAQRRYHKWELHAPAKIYPKMMAAPCGHYVTDIKGKMTSHSITETMASEIGMLPCMRCYRRDW